MKTLQETLEQSVQESLLDSDTIVNSKIVREVTKYYETYIKDLKIGEKIKTLSKEAVSKIGKAVMLKILNLFYLLIDSNIEVKDKMLIVSALLYLISPIDAIPDAAAIGFTDDIAVITYIFNFFRTKITSDIEQKSEDTYNRWFGK